MTTWGGIRDKGRCDNMNQYSPKDVATKQTFGNVEIDENEDVGVTLNKFFEVFEEKDESIQIMNMLTHEPIIVLKKRKD